MRLVAIILFFCSCSFKIDSLKSIYVTLYEIHKTEIGYELIWRDDKGIPFSQGIEDTTAQGLHLGMSKEYLVKL